jgi:hypothetical protein
MMESGVALSVHLVDIAQKTGVSGYMVLGAKKFVKNRQNSLEKI